VTHNSLSKNLDGIVLLGANKNELRNNTACENSDVGLQIQDSEENIVTHNSLSMNLYGIGLIRANKNELRNNNVVDSKNYQARVEDSYLNKFNYNYWSDYEAQYPDAQEKGNSGIGDIPYEIDEANKDVYPYLSYSGWLSVVITPEYWEFYTKKGDIQYFYMNFSIQNRLNSPTEVELLLDQNLEFAADSERATTKTFCIEPKSTENITLRLNVTNLEGYILRTITFKTEEYMKTTLVHGLVQPKINEVKIEGVDYHRNVVKGQINPFNVILRNHGDRDVFNVTLTMGSKEKSKRVFLSDNKSRTKTVPFEIDTSDMPLGIIRGQVVVLKSNQASDPPLDYLNLTLYVASELEASTLIVTNLSRFNESKDLRHELVSLTHHPAVNGILLDVSCNYTEFDSYYKANKLCEEIKNQIESVITDYPNIKYLIIVGDDRVIPFYRVIDGTTEVFTVITGLPNESVYYNSDHYKSAGPKHISDSVDEALSSNHFLTDDFYAQLAAGRVLAVGRLVEKPDEIIKAIDMFFNHYQLTPTNVFVTGYDFMYDGSAECFEEWHKRTDTTFKYKQKKNTNYADPDEIISKISNSSISAIFLHANYNEFEVPSGISPDRELLDVEEIKALNGSIIYTMGCHAGLSIPDVKDLPQTFLSHGTIAYIAPTGYGLGGIITVAGHEKLLKYLTKRIARGEEIGFALMNAKNDYYLDNFNQDTLDDKVMKSLTLYGFSMYAVRLDSPSITAMSKDVEEQSTTDLAYSASSITLEEATLTLKPSFKIYETENGTYYSYESYTTEAGMPILPKATWYFIRGDKEIRGIVLHSARFDVNETRLAIETFAVSDGTGSVNELKGWYPTIPFSLNTIEDRQNIVIASAQYKKAKWSKKGTIRLFNEIVLDLFRVPVDAEREKPVVDVANDTGTVTVEDNAGIYDVFVTYLDAANNSWVSTSLGHGDRDKTSVEYNVQLNNTVFFVQVVDVNGNVKIDDNSGLYYAC